MISDNPAEAQMDVGNRTPQVDTDIEKSVFISVHLWCLRKPWIEGEARL